MKIRVVALFGVCLAACAVPARAQLVHPGRIRPPRPLPVRTDPVTSELHVYAGLWNLGQSQLYGVKYDRDFSPVLAVEGGLEAGSLSDRGPTYGMFTVALRVSAQPPASDGTAYVSLGLAVPAGLRYGISPVIGFGAQSPWIGPIALRGDLQILTRGSGTLDRLRVTVGFSVAFP